MKTREQRTILVVEPDPAIRSLVAALLRCEGYLTEAVDSADAAVQARHSSRPSAVVIEPRMRGGDLLLAGLRADPEISARVVVITTPDWHELAYAAGDGVRGVLRKPFFLHELTALVASCFNDGAGAPNVRSSNRNRRTVYPASQSLSPERPVSEQPAPGGYSLFHRRQH